MSSWLLLCHNFLSFFSPVVAGGVFMGFVWEQSMMIIIFFFLSLDRLSPFCHASSAFVHESHAWCKTRQVLPVICHNCILFGWYCSIERLETILFSHVDLPLLQNRRYTLRTARHNGIICFVPFDFKSVNFSFSHT